MMLTCGAKQTGTWGDETIFGIVGDIPDPPHLGKPKLGFLIYGILGFLCWIDPQLAFRKQIPHVLHFWTGAPSCYLELLDKLQKQIHRTVGPSLAASLKPLAHHQNVDSLSLFYRYYFARCSSELAQLIPLPFLWEVYSLFW